MDFRFEKFVEHWCSIYKPLQHVLGEKSKNKRFFLTDTTYLGMADFMTNIDSRISACVVMEGAVEGTTKGGLDMPSETIYFFVKADKMQSGRSARNAMYEAKKHKEEFVKYMREQQKLGVEELQQFNLDERISYEPLGPLYNGWYAIYITLDNVQQMNMCTNPDDYIENPKIPYNRQQ